jgi:hypothetical protein
MPRGPEVPAGAPTGHAVAVFLTIGGVSNTVTIAVH